LQKIDDLVDGARKLLRTASDPISAVVRFLHERPEDSSLSGYVVDKVLAEAFGDDYEIPGLVNILAGHVKEIIRTRNVIDIIKEHPAVEKWGTYLIKQTDRIKFEVSRENNKLVLKNIGGLIAVEHGIEIPLDKILVNPPKLEVTLRFGLLRPQRIVDIV
jgi:hypothetical protein